MWSSLIILNTELLLLKKIFLKKGYTEHFINKCLKRLMDNIHVVKETTLTVEKKPSVLNLRYLGSTSLQTRTKLKKSLNIYLSLL